MSKGNEDLKTSPNIQMNDIYESLEELENCDGPYSPLQEMQSNFSQNQLWERKINTNITSNSFEGFQAVLQSHEKLTDLKNNMISEFSIESPSPFSEMFEDCRESQKHSFFKNDIPSLFVHDNYFQKRGGQIQESRTEKKMESSKSFQCISTRSFSSSQITQSNNGNSSAESSHFQNLQFASAFSSVQNGAFSEMNGGNVSNLHAKECASRMVSANSFEFVRYSNVYSINNEHIPTVREVCYDSVSESDDDEEEEIHNELDFIKKDAIEYQPINTNRVNAGNSSMLMIEYDMKKDKIQQTLQKIAFELLTTERTYVGILHLLDQVFAFRVDQVNRVHPMFSQEIVAQMFTNLKSLYKLHHDFLLPQLEERMSNWEENRRLGDIMKNFAPFLKMYTEYVKNYDNAVKLINICYQKHQRFQQILDELHTQEECKQLTLQHHMLTPVQRVPRYQLLLKDYLKKLPEDSPDKCDTEKALELVSIAANHANDTMKKIDKFKKLLEIQEMIGGSVDLVSPSRELTKEGKIIKISARSGDHQERYIFLFSDLLLLCSHRLLPNKVVSGPCFRLRAKFDVDNLIIEEGDNLETANTFYLRTTGRVIELYTPTREGKMDWMETLRKAVAVLAEKKSSLKVGDHEIKAEDTIELGTRAPNFVKLESTTHCMCCDSIFSTFTFRRKHHCHACGIVACNKCLMHKVPLSYEGGKQCKVCLRCFEFLVKNVSKSELIKEHPKNVHSPQRQKGILDVNPTDPSIVSGYLQLKARSRFWVRRWFALHDDFVLYSFNSHTDEMALTSMPLPGYTIGLTDKNDNVDGRENVFKLYHKKKMYFFQTSDESDLQRWVVALDKASKAESSS